MAFRIDTGDRSFVYSGDAALCGELESLALNADLLIHWCYRMTGQTTNNFIRKMSPDPVEIAQLAGKCGVAKLLITHLRQQMDDDESRDRMLDDLRKNFAGDAGIAEHLLEIFL